MKHLTSPGEKRGENKRVREVEENITKGHGLWDLVHGRNKFAEHSDLSLCPASSLTCRADSG